MSRRLTIGQLEALDQDLRSLLAQIEDGRLEANASLRHRIEGAMAAISVALGRSPRSALGLTEPQD
jgi:hypothetical protein